MRWQKKSTGSADQGGGHGASPYDGRPMRAYRFRAARDGRVITVLSSWRPGEPGR